MLSRILLSLCVLSVFAGNVQAEPLSGEYLEARTCDVYTGPCFANAEMGLCGNEAIMAWKVKQGDWKGVPLAGLSAALVVNAENTLGDDGVFGFDPGRTKSVLLIDEKASSEQQQALQAFVRSSAGALAKNIVAVRRVPIELKNDDINGRAQFVAAGVAEIRTRDLDVCDCVCTNEIVYYQPLSKVKDFSPAYTLSMSYRGDALGNRWTNRSLRSAFVASFGK